MHRILRHTRTCTSRLAVRTCVRTASNGPWPGGGSPGLTVCVSRVSRVSSLDVCGVQVTCLWEPGAALLPQRDAARHMKGMAEL
jgi:hypothetical protein